MFALFICYNPISYHVAQRVIRHEKIARALVLWDARRFRRVPGAVGWHLPMGSRSHQFIHLLASMGAVSSAHVPHMRVTISRLQSALAHVPEFHYLDDGLDTLRLLPRNFDVDSLMLGRRYYTFREYGRLPDWLEKLDVRRVGELTDLWVCEKPGVAFPVGSHVLIESPGVQVDTLVAELTSQGQVPILVRHPVAAKRAACDTRSVRMWQGSGNLDTDISVSKDAHFHIGETMSLVVALYGPSKDANTWHVRLTPQQRENLVFLAA